MSAETSGWLNRMTLIGNTLKRGMAWHWRAEDQGEESNHYEGFVPVEDVKRRLFNFEAVSKPVYAKNSDGTFKVIDGKQAITHSNNGEVFGVVSNRYQIHQYEDVLLKNLEAILDSNELGIDSAGLLQKGSRAWVQISVPENLSSTSGFEFRPTLIATTSHDGMRQTQYLRCLQAVVCDNTLQLALNENADHKVKIRHNRSAQLNDLGNLREALEIVYSAGSDMMEELEKLSSWAVTDNQFDALVKDLFPINMVELTMKDESGKTIIVPSSTQDTRSAGKQNPKRDLLNGLWRTDPRVLPWKNTALGVIQATTTFHQHLSGSDKNRYNRNYTRLVSNQQAEYDKMVLAKLELVTA
jgi:phage/plasmid-like protein (TIGR03299 family)